VFGFGEKKTPEAFRNACHRFVFTEVLRPSNPVEAAAVVPASAQRSFQSSPPAEAAEPKSSKRKTKKETKSAPVQQPEEATESKLEFPTTFVLTALEQSIDDTGWANLAIFGGYLAKIKPDFDSRLYGYKKLSDLVKDQKDIFVIEERINPASNKKDLFLRAK
jgi:hypothetical protein